MQACDEQKLIRHAIVVATIQGQQPKVHAVFSCFLGLHALVMLKQTTFSATERKN